jgi:hypothetical protein
MKLWKAIYFPLSLSYFGYGVFSLHFYSPPEGLVGLWKHTAMIPQWAHYRMVVERFLFITIILYEYNVLTT